MATLAGDRKARADALVMEAQFLPEPERARWLKKARAVRACGSIVVASVCPDHGPEPGTAEFTSPLALHCRSRGCPACCRRESQQAIGEMESRVAQMPALLAARVAKKQRELEADLRAREAKLVNQRGHDLKQATQGLKKVRRALAIIRGMKDWRWTMLTIGVDWDPMSPEQNSVAGMQARIRGLLKVAQALWTSKKGLDRGGLGLATMMTGVEMSSLGHIHLHAMVFGPNLFPFQATLEQVAKAAYPDAGRIELTPMDDLKGGVRELLKYPIKGNSVLSTTWLAGATRETTNPVASARFEIAATGIKLRRIYGLLTHASGADEPTAGDAGDDAGDDQVEAAGDQDATREGEVPSRCSVCDGPLERVSMPTSDFGRLCLRTGRPGFGRARKPPDG